MAKSELFKAAHKLAKEIRSECSDYRTAFSCALKAIYEGYIMETESTEQKLSRLACEVYRLEQIREALPKYDKNGKYGVNQAYKEAARDVVLATRALKAVPCERKQFRRAIIEASQKFPCSGTYTDAEAWCQGMI